MKFEMVVMKFEMVGAIGKLISLYLTDLLCNLRSGTKASKIPTI